MKHDENSGMENGNRTKKKSRIRKLECHGDSDEHRNLRRSDRIRKRNEKDSNEFQNKKIRVSEERKEKQTKFEDEVKKEEKEDSDGDVRGFHEEANVEEEHTGDTTHASASSLQDVTSSFENDEGTSALRSHSSPSIHDLPTEMNVTPELLEDMKGRIESLHNKLDMLEAKERSLTAKIAELEQMTLLHDEAIQYILRNMHLQHFVLPPHLPPSAEDTDDHSYGTGPPSAEDTDDHSYDTGSQSSDSDPDSDSDSDTLSS